MRCGICDVVYPVTDAPGTGPSFGSVANAGAYIRSASGNVLTRTLPASTAPGSYVAIIPVGPGVRTCKTADPVDPVAVSDTLHNPRLGMRHVRAVYEAQTKRLSPEVRSKVRVEAVDDLEAPVQASREYATRSCGP